jgi:hypothetical protein
MTPGACVSPAERAQQLAQSADLSGRIMSGTDFRHETFSRIPESADRLFVFIDGDGNPYTEGGAVVSPDPSPRRPLALQWAAQTPAPVLYVARPCEFRTLRDPGCTPRLWTTLRYSASVVGSLSAIVNQVVAARHVRAVILIGYSGGGTLAVLMAGQVKHLAAVVTIAAVLDTDAWTTHHAYLPLEGSLNPATQPPLPMGLRHIYLIGGRDDNTPEGLNARYLNANSSLVWRYPQFDHVCCWTAQWPAIFARIQAELAT